MTQRSGLCIVATVALALFSVTPPVHAGTRGGVRKAPSFLEVCWQEIVTLLAPSASPVSPSCNGAAAGGSGCVDKVQPILDQRCMIDPNGQTVCLAKT
jgi:hypothetical protein